MNQSATAEKCHCWTLWNAELTHLTIPQISFQYYNLILIQERLQATIINAENTGSILYQSTVSIMSVINTTQQSIIHSFGSLVWLQNCSSNFLLHYFFTDNSRTFPIFPDVSLTSLKFPEISRSSRQVVTFFLTKTQLNSHDMTQDIHKVDCFIRSISHSNK